MARFAIDAMTLEEEAFGHRSLTWWGNAGYIAIEATGFVLAGTAYLLLMQNGTTWPPQPLPSLQWSSLLTLILVASVVPNLWIKRQAEQEQLRAVRLGLVLMSAIGLILLGVRALEFTTLNCRWDRPMSPTRWC
jgi:heme/copper-type cytochrome/quinol oxidase subunit 3